MAGVGRHGLIVLALLLGLSGVRAATCEHEDFDTRVSGESECLLMRRFGAVEPAAMVVWLHGNITSGGPADGHFRLAEQVARGAAPDAVLAVALVRPGYPDGSGAFSSGRDRRRADNWQRADLQEVATAVERLRQRYRPRVVLLVGHSGGAAIAAVLLGLQPQLAQAALLLACPCDLPTWRRGKPGPYWLSEDPLRWADAVPAQARVVALTGSRDDTTPPALAQAYVQRLRARGVDARFDEVADAGHVDLLGHAQPAAVTRELLRELLTGRKG